MPFGTRDGGLLPESELFRNRLTNPAQTGRRVPAMGVLCGRVLRLSNRSNVSYPNKLHVSCGVRQSKWDMVVGCQSELRWNEFGYGVIYREKTGAFEGKCGVPPGLPRGIRPELTTRSSLRRQRRHPFQRRLR